MSLFGNKDIIPDDIAEKIAQNLFVRYNQGLEYHIDEDIKRYDAYVDIKMKPFWHYCCGDHHYTFKIDRKIREDMEFYDLFLKGNGYLSLDRFNCIHAVNKESFIKVLDLVKDNFAAQDKGFVYRIFHDRYYKSKCFVPYAYITLEQKLLRGDGKGHTTMCRFPQPAYRRFSLKDAPYATTLDNAELKTEVALSGITLLGEQELLAYKKYVDFQQKDHTWWLRDRFPNMPRCSKAIQPNEMILPRSIEKRNGISPAVTGNFGKFKCGTKLLFAGYKWTVVSSGMMFIDDLLGVGPYNFYSSDDRIFEDSDVRRFLENWFQTHREDPVYLVK